MFAVVQTPNPETTWVFDFLTQRWHERGLYNAQTDLFVPDHAICHMYAFGKHLVGDRYSGAIYHMDTSFFDEQLI